MPEQYGYTWFTMVSHFDDEGYVRENPVGLWCCNICAGLVAGDCTEKHLAYHRRNP